MSSSSEASPSEAESRSERRARRKRERKGRRRLIEQEVPSSRISRIVGLGGMVAKVAMSAAGSAMSSNRVDSSESGAKPSSWVDDQVADTIASELCRMRGAALKVGQILSLQDEQNLPPALARALERVRTEANIMPQWQLESAMRASLGSEWRSRFGEFGDEPVAAASIGQVHWATLADTGQPVAVKVQYPGVADGIQSDMSNIASLLNFSALLPKGLFTDRVVATATEELAAECDYTREAANQERARGLVEALGGGLRVPRVVPELSTRAVLTSEWVDGDPVDALVKDGGAPQETRDSVGTRLMRVTLRELFQWRFVQSDPNWSNFLYDPDADVLALIDFGAAMEYPGPFVESYLELVRACADRDREAILRISKDMGFLNGKESPRMVAAHVEAGYIMGEPFAQDAVFDFGKFNHGKRMAEQGQVFMNERLVPPPKEVYTLHRKLFGMMSTCVKLGARIPCRELLNEVSGV